MTLNFVRTALATGLALLAGTGATFGAVEKIQIKSREPYHASRVGPYVKITGTFVGSLDPAEPIPNLALSNVMRAGVTALVKTLSIELAPNRIRINTLLPGRIATDRLQYLDGINAERAGITVEEQTKRATSAIPFGRYGEPAEFGRAGAFLLSDAASYITGAALQVDGGLLKGLL